MQTIPTTKELAESVRASIESAFGVMTPLLPKAAVDVISKAIAGVLILLYKYASSIQLNLLPSTASLRETRIGSRTITPGEEWGVLIGAGPAKVATQAVHTIEISVKQQVGTLDAGTQLIRLQTGYVYTLDEAVDLDAATKPASITAVSDPSGEGGAGTGGNLQDGDIITFANPLASVVRDAVVTGQTVIGANAEASEVYRGRYTRQFRRRKRGGAGADYQAWGEAVPGVINVYPGAGSDPNIVLLYVEVEATELNPDGIPDSTQLDAVTQAANFDENGKLKHRPVGAFVVSLAITRLEFDVEIVGLDTNDNATTLTDIESAVSGFMLDREPYILGLTDGARRDRITHAEIGGIISSVVNNAGGVFTSFVLKKDTNEISAYTLDFGEKAKLASLTEI